MKKREFVLDMVFGTLCSVSWAYILQQQVDPRATCPGVERTRCWALVVVYASNMFLGVLYIPALVLWILSVSHRFRQRRCCRKNVERTFAERETLRRLTAFATATATVAWSISVSTTLSQLLGELEYEATKGRATSSGGSGPRISSDPDDRGPGYRQPDDAKHPPPPRRLTEDVSMGDMLRVVAARAELCFVALSLCSIVMLWANQRLLRAAKPLTVEICMLLRSSLHYASAYCIVTVFSSVWFLPLDVATLKTGRQFVYARLVWVIVKVFVFGGIARAIARRLPPFDAETAHDWRRCFCALWHKTLAVVACLVVYDATAYIVYTMLPLSDLNKDLVYLGYAFFVLAVAFLRRAGVFKLCRRRTPSNYARLADQQAPKDDARARSDAAFVDVAEAWIVCFAFWVPFEALLINAYDLSNNVSEHARTSIGRHVVRLVWQLFLGSCVVAVCVAVTTLLANIHRCCQKADSEATDFLVVEAFDDETSPDAALSCGLTPQDSHELGAQDDEVKEAGQPQQDPLASPLVSL